nr:zinc-finger domain-containing protein [Roseospirillum parvum]
MTRETRVMCDGGEGPLGHPAVYLSIRPDVGEEICPYCSRRFVLDRGDRAA